ncbi:MAG: cytochrome ubiquinol oxidase subunit I [Acidimicrobiales bacterium]
MADTSALLAAREQMAFTLGFHILLVPFGVVLPFLTLIANRRAIKWNDDDALLLARRWSKVIGVLFAVGAVTGTVLSFEFGLLWPGLTGRFGDVFGLPFAIEGIAFFLEAILVALYIYSWDRVGPRAHFWLGAPLPFVAVLGSCSILAANAWMNTPQGFTIDANGEVTNVQVREALITPAFWYTVGHFLLAALLCAGFMVASIYAVGMLKGRRDRYHRIGFLIGFTVAAIAMPLQLFMGDQIMRAVLVDQPVKFAAIELIPTTSTDVPEVIGGHIEDGKVVGGIKIPGLASFLAGFNTDTELQGLDIVPVEDRPPATLVHWAFDVMIGAATFLTLVVLWFAWVWWRKRDLPTSKWFLRAAATCGVVSMIAMEAGWVTTEVGRQPWVVYNVLRTEDAVTSSKGVWITFPLIVVIYLTIAVVTVKVLRRMSARWRAEGAITGGPYAPAGTLVLPDAEPEPAHAAAPEPEATSPAQGP